MAIMKNKTLLTIILVVGILILFAFIYRSCSHNDDGMPIEKYSILSPNNQFYAIVFERFQEYDYLYIVPAEAKVQRDDYVMRFSHAKDFSIFWESNVLLNVKYSKICIESFKNVAFVGKNHETIEIKLVQTSKGHAFPYMPDSIKIK
jgi:hypothetical protein